MTKPIIVSVLGADRVGKTTAVNMLAQDLDQKMAVKSTKLHFSGPQPHHNSPIEQYITPLDEALNSSPRVIICDRGFSEVCFYEKFRRHIDISEEWAIAAESYFLSKSMNTHVFLIRREWEWCKYHHHLEIVQQFPDASPYFINNQLLIREKEHFAYYDYMEYYLKHKSLLNPRILTPEDNAKIDLYGGIFL
jgi:hypothetical protein